MAVSAVVTVLDSVVLTAGVAVPVCPAGPPSCLSPQSLCSFCSNALPSDLTGFLQDSPGATEMNPGEMIVTEGKMRCHLRPLGKELQQLHFTDGHTEAW